MPILALGKLEIALILGAASLVGLVGFVAAGVALRLRDLRRLTRR